MKHYREEDVLEIFAHPEFQETYAEFKRDNADLRDFRKFVDSIGLNTKYFRLTMNKGSKRYKNRNLGEDTIAIKEIKSYLNKISDRNYTKISTEIKNRLVDRDYLMTMMITTIIEKCIANTPYITIYLQLISDMYGSVDDWKERVCENLDAVYKKIITQETDKTESDYLQFCQKNKVLDQCIGHSLLVTECEKLKIVRDRFHPMVDRMITMMKDESDSEEKYKCVQCLYTMFRSYYGDAILPEGYLVKLQALIDSETAMKLKFRMMDILERR